MKRSAEFDINKSSKIHRNTTYKKYIIEIKNNDNYCLFYAIELMRFYSIYKCGKITESAWRWLKENQTTKLKEEVIILLRTINIPLDESDYDGNYIRIVQEYWNYKYPGEYKIFIFNNFQTTPIIKSDVTEYQFPILIYHHDNHFD